MSNAEFIKRATAAVVDYFNRHVDVTDNFELTAEDTFVVWSCKTLQNNKALISTTIPDGMYYEITYNGDKGEMYLDAYKRCTMSASKSRRTNMDFASFGIASVACITVICYLAATAVKQTPLANKWLPSICGALGGLLGLAAMYINVPDFPATDPLTALAVGIVSGLAATGADQVIKQIGKDN